MGVPEVLAQIKIKILLKGWPYAQNVVTLIVLLQLQFFLSSLCHA